VARIKPPFKYYGGKFYLCKWILSHAPAHRVYVEPFGGAASVLLNKERSEVEVYNDLCPDVTAVMTAIRDYPDKFMDALFKIPCEEKLYYQYKESSPADEFQRAIRAYVVYRMSRGGTATTFSKSNRSYRGLPENVAAWDTGIRNIPTVSKRLQGVQITTKDAISLCQEMDCDDAWFYLDPPYVSKTRINENVYKLEMDEAGHIQLAEAARGWKAKTILSGYDGELYRRLYPDWTCVQKEVYLHGGHSRKKQLVQECLWLNFPERRFENGVSG
jgi:DNA adenine methylase